LDGLNGCSSSLTPSRPARNIGNNTYLERQRECCAGKTAQHDKNW
jgi:hypothetical protein